MATKPFKIEVEMALDRETKNTFRFAAEAEDGDVIDTVYVQKSAFDGDAPQKVTVTLEGRV